MTNRTTDPRALQLAKTRQRLAHQDVGSTANWNNFTASEQRLLIEEASTFLRAAVEAGIAPPAERPTNEHMAVYVDDEGYLYGEYPTAPSSDSICRLVWANGMCESKAEMEDAGAEFRLLGWST